MEQEISHPITVSDLFCSAVGLRPAEESYLEVSWEAFEENIVQLTKVTVKIDGRAAKVVMIYNSFDLHRA